MKVLLAQRSSYVPVHGGANKANRFIMESLASRGHQCRVLVSVRPMQHYSSEVTLQEHLAMRGIVFEKCGQGGTFTLNGVEVSAVGEDTCRGTLHSSNLCERLRSELGEWKPDVVLIASEDQYQFLLSTAVDVCPKRVVYLARSSSMLGVGHFAFFPNPRSAYFLQSVAAIVSNSRYLRDYIFRCTGVSGLVMDFQTYGEPPFPNLGKMDTKHITMVNPCSVKGISIFVELAKMLPCWTFRAIPGWGTTKKDLQTLDALTNVTVAGPFDDVDEMLSETRILLVPSLWDEAFGRVVVEAMLRGIPVLAANVGGLPEATLGAGLLLPVNMIDKFMARFDEAIIPEAEIPAQDPRPWRDNISALMMDRSLYFAASSRCRDAALGYVQSLSFEPFISLLSRVQHQEQTPYGQLQSR